MASAASSVLGQLSAALLLAGCVAAHFSETPPEEQARVQREVATLAAVRELGRDGDWLVIRGYHASDNLVAGLTNKPFSHAAVLDRAGERVIEAEAQGVHFTPLAEFVHKSHRLLLVRPVWSDERSAAGALRTARGAVGRPYDFLGLIGVDIPERYYCSGLAIEIYRPYIRADDAIPRPVEPGQLHHWGRILYDSGAL
jgi:permuted papain-like amidase YaeF/Yiix C92 family enzyme